MITSELERDPRTAVVRTLCNLAAQGRAIEIHQLTHGRGTKACESVVMYEIFGLSQETQWRLDKIQTRDPIAVISSTTFYPTTERKQAFQVYFEWSERILGNLDPEVDVPAIID